MRPYFFAQKLSACTTEGSNEIAHIEVIVTQSIEARNPIPEPRTLAMSTPIERQEVIANSFPKTMLPEAIPKVPNPTSKMIERQSPFIFRRRRLEGGNSSFWRPYASSSAVSERE